MLTLLSKFLFLPCLVLLLLYSFGCESITNSTRKIAENSPKSLKKPYVILVSIDGYRFDYTKKYGPKALTKFKNNGSYTKGLRPSYPTKTFPNHYSIVTGMRAETHGIVANTFWDPIKKKRYAIGTASPGRGHWYGGEPLWLATQKQGMLSASFFWIGSDADIQGSYPTYYRTYNGKVPNQDRVDQVVRWLKLPEKKRPHFITLYFSDVDSAGHRYGPDSKEVKKSVHEIDSVLSSLFEQVAKIDLPINIMIVSDHGMQLIEPKKTFALEDYISINGIRIEGRGSHSLLYFKEKNQHRIDFIYERLKKIPYLTVYKKGELPADYGYTNHQGIGDLIIAVKPGHYMEIKSPKAGERLKDRTGGTHGYDPKETELMNGIFYAKGPNIRKLGEIERFDNIHIYPLIMDILGLEIRSKIDGKRDVLSKLRD